MLGWPAVTGGSERVGLVGKRKVQGRFNTDSEAVLEWKGKRPSHLLLRLEENILYLV